MEERFNFNPLSSSDKGVKNAGDLQIVFGANYEKNKFLNSTSTGVFATGDLSNTNFTGVKYKKNLGEDFTFVSSGFAGYTYIDKASNSYIDSSTPLFTSSFTLGLAKANFIKDTKCNINKVKKDYNWKPLINLSKGIKINLHE